MRSILLGLLVSLASASGFAGQSTSLNGIWLGVLNIPGTHIRLAYRITANRDGSLSVVHDSPDFGVKEIPVRRALVRGDSLFVDIALFEAFFEGRIGREEITGRYRHNGPWIPLRLRRVRPRASDLLDYMVPRLDVAGEREREYAYRVPEETSDGWKRAHAGALGIDTARIARLIRHILAEDYPDIHSLVIVKDGKLVLDEYFYGLTSGELHPIHSITKSVVCLLAGLALEEGSLRYQSIADFFPEYHTAFTGGKERITVEHLLSMSSGLEWDEYSFSYYDPRNDVNQMGQADDCIGFVLEHPLRDPPGSVYNYNSGMMVVLAEILRRATGEDVPALARSRLFGPLGISEFMWEYYAEGSLRGGGGLHLRSRDLAKLGYLYTHRGDWKGTQLISPSWFDRSNKGRRQCGRPAYWNHWGAEIFSVSGHPVRGFSGGGFGGQTITGFPDLDLVVAINAGNFTTSADYDEMVREFILPAVLGEGHPQADTAALSGTMLKNLEWQPALFSNLGCLKGCLDFLGRSCSMDWLYGASGYAFALNVEERVESRALGVWNNARTFELSRNLGIRIETVSGHKSNEAFAEIQRRAWDLVREAIDEGVPCYGFNLNAPESYLICGYDDRGYYFKGGDCLAGLGPTCWEELGRTDIGWLEVHAVAPAPPETVEKTVADALRFSLDVAHHPEEFTYEGFSGGLEAYEQWIAALEEDKADPFGLAYTAAAWAEARAHAVGFLREAKHRLPAEYAPRFDRAIKEYRGVSSHLQEVSDLFPFHGTLSWEMMRNCRDPARRAGAVAHLRAALEAETRGLERLDEIVDALKL